MNTSIRTFEMLLQVLPSVCTGGAMGAVITWLATSKRERANRLRQFRCQMSILKSDLQELPDTEEIGGGPIQEFFKTEARTVRVECAKVSFEIHSSRREQFEAAAADFYKMEERAMTRGKSFMSERLAHGTQAPYTGPADVRSKKQQLMDALSKIIEFAQ